MSPDTKTSKKRKLGDELPGSKVRLRPYLPDDLAEDMARDSQQKLLYVNPMSLSY